MTINYSTLISTAELAQHVHQSNWIILDCRHDLMDPQAGKMAYVKGHIPQAQFAHLDQDLSGNKTNSQGVFLGRHPLPDRPTFIARARAWGINADSQVVAYDAQGGMYAARLWWLLRWIGHSAVAVLDGGLPAWTSAGQPLSEESLSRPAGNLIDQPSLVKVATLEEVVANLQTQQKTVFDARSPDRYRGENETMDPVGGHIPKAKNRFFKDNLQANGCFKSAAELRQELATHIPNANEAIMQCGSGVTACHNLLALEVAGMAGAALYPGSWSEWCADTSRPVALQ